MRKDVVAAILLTLTAALFGVPTTGAVADPEERAAIAMNVD